MYPVSEPVKGTVQRGYNTIRVALKNIGRPAALKVCLRVQHEDGHETVIDSDDSWEWTSGRIEGPSHDHQWKQAAVTRSQNTWSQTDSAFGKHIQFAEVKDDYRELNRALIKFACCCSSTRDCLKINWAFINSDLW